MPRTKTTLYLEPESRSVLGLYIPRDCAFEVKAQYANGSRIAQVLRDPRTGAAYLSFNGSIVAEALDVEILIPYIEAWKKEFQYNQDMEVIAEEEGMRVR